MKRLVLLCLFSYVIVGIAACSGMAGAVEHASTSPTNVTVSPSSGSSGASTPTVVSLGTATSTVASLRTAIPTTMSPGTATPTMMPPGTTITAVATSYYRAIAAQNYQSAFTFLDANATGPDGQRVTLQVFLQLAHTMENEGGPVTSFSVAASQSMIIMTINRQKIGPYHAHLQMKQEENIWKIISIDRT